MSRRTRTYSELVSIDSFQGRYEYLKLGGVVGETTFGHDRILNQQFYTSAEWRHLRHAIIARDLGCDLAWPDFPVHTRVMIHHMNPVTEEQIVHGDQSIFDPEFLISCSHRTHNAIHYGDESQLPRVLVERRPGDTKLW